jgi:hypothetical protein
MSTNHWYEAYRNDPQRRDSNSTLKLMWVWSLIDCAKRNGNDLTLPINLQQLLPKCRNKDRNFFE